MRERGEEEGIESCRCCHGYLACARGGGEGIAIWPPTQNLAVHMRTSWVGYFLRQAWVCE